MLKRGCGRVSGDVCSAAGCTAAASAHCPRRHCCYCLSCCSRCRRCLCPFCRRCHCSRPSPLPLRPLLPLLPLLLMPPPPPLLLLLPRCRSRHHLPPLPLPAAAAARHAPMPRAGPRAACAGRAGRPRGSGRRRLSSTQSPAECCQDLFFSFSLGVIIRGGSGGVCDCVCVSVASYARPRSSLPARVPAWPGGK